MPKQTINSTRGSDLGLKRSQKSSKLSQANWSWLPTRSQLKAQDRRIARLRFLSYQIVREERTYTYVLTKRSWVERTLLRLQRAWRAIYAIKTRNAQIVD